MSPPHSHAKPVEFPAQCHPEIRDRLTRLETIVGDSPDEGLRFDIGDLKKAFHAMEKRMYIAIGGGAVLYYVADHVMR